MMIDSTEYLLIKLLLSLKNISIPAIMAKIGAVATNLHGADIGGA